MPSAKRPFQIAAPVLAALLLLVSGTPAPADRIDPFAYRSHWWWWALAAQRNSTREVPLTNQIILGAHNAYNCTVAGGAECDMTGNSNEGDQYLDENFCAPNQKRNIQELLNAGVRYFELDIQWPVATADFDYRLDLDLDRTGACAELKSQLMEAAPHVTLEELELIAFRNHIPEVRHGSHNVFCLGGVLLPVFLEQINEWVLRNPTEVVFLEFENNYVDQGNFLGSNEVNNSDLAQDCRTGLLRALLSLETLTIDSRGANPKREYRLFGSRWMEDQDWVHPSIYERPECRRRPPAPSPAELLRLGNQVWAANLETHGPLTTRRPGRYWQPENIGHRAPDRFGFPRIEDDLNFRSVQGDRLNEGNVPIFTKDVKRYASMSGVIIKMDRVLDETFHPFCLECPKESDKDGDRNKAAVWSWKEGDKAVKRWDPDTHNQTSWSDLDDVAVQETCQNLGGCGPDEAPPRWISTSPDAGTDTYPFALRRIRRTEVRNKWWDKGDFVPKGSQGVYEWKLSQFESSRWHDFLRVPMSELDDDGDGFAEWMFAGPENGLQRQLLAETHIAALTTDPVWINVQDLDRNGLWEINAPTFRPLPVPSGETDVSSMRVFDESVGATFGIVGGADAAAFELLDGHFLAFKSAPDHAAPTDADADSRYEVQILMRELIGDTIINFSKRIFATVEVVDPNAPLPEPPPSQPDVCGPEVDVPSVEPEPSVEGGEAFVFAGLPVDPVGVTFPLTCSVGHGDGSVFKGGEVDGTICTGPPHVYHDDGLFLVTARVIDAAGEIGVNHAFHGVTNVAPTASLSVAPQEIRAGEVARLAFADETDPSLIDTQWGFEYRFDCEGDGVFETEFDRTDHFVCSYGASGTFVPVGAIRDKDGGTTEIVASDSLTVITGAAAAQELVEALDAIVQDHPGTELADKVEDVRDKVATAVDELEKAPPEREAALGNLEGAVGDLESALSSGLPRGAELGQLMDELVALARAIAAQAVGEAQEVAAGEEETEEALDHLAEGDERRDEARFKDAVASYKDAVAKAESVLQDVESDVSSRSQSICGVGLELALLMPGLLWLRRRRARAG